MLIPYRESPSKIGNIPTIPTSSLPDGRPEEEMKTAKEHKLGHVSSIKKVVDS
jgi:hypothetical protein